ncbi:uncharacterized protein BCR38DRAFT_193840 [Pseudomassariella vexata]|uniref:Uncharacterized protein n=1 Tax=Pseudomassariella vexata TaxID=1141098 RepID=A0A1Y2E1Q0_9PEZI|nr:uncharacterized protein BCR38DRAFT_193840 [Pseudomassariella vexata]ORY65246.1 hypothetical protein BCR38DRAFT_193840 [Pseudomassariella vexata]
MSSSILYSTWSLPLLTNTISSATAYSHRHFNKMVCRNPKSRHSTRIPAALRKLSLGPATLRRILAGYLPQVCTGRSKQKVELSNSHTPRINNNMRIGAQMAECLFQPPANVYVYTYPCPIFGCLSAHAEDDGSWHPQNPSHNA